MPQLSQKELAEFFNVSTRAIRDWDKAGCPSHADGKAKHYIPHEVHAWLVQRAVEAAGNDLPLDINDEEIRAAQRAQVIAKAEREQANAEMALIELARKKADLVPREVAEGALSDAIAEFSQALDRIPYRYPAQLGACKTDAARRDVLRKAVDEARVALSRIELKEEEQEEETDANDGTAASE